ncbi:MAG: hypothetical protein WA405_00405 [Candidatus Acidiferrales bacterium]
MAKVKAIALGLILVAASGCDTSGRISRLERQNEDFKAEMEKNSAAVDYDLQAKCSKDARAWFNENWSSDKNTMLLDFNNHYNKALNKCFILVEYHYSTGVSASWMNSMTLWDVYENLKYGNLSENHSIDFKSEPRDEVITCEVADKKCTTSDQFVGLTWPYLNN